MKTKENNECLIDYLRFSIPESTVKDIAENVLCISICEFTNEIKSSPYPSYTGCYSFANINIHNSEKHSSVLVDMSGKGCRQYEEYMSSAKGWHWQALIETIICSEGKVTRIDLALDIYDSSSPSVKVLQDYVKRGQLSSKSHKFMEINSGRILDGKLLGYSLYIGSSPQILRIYDKKQERLDNNDEIVLVDKWVRWELEITENKAMQVAYQISSNKPLNTIIKGILSAHYSFKTQQKGKKDFHNKSRLPNMKWWDKFINDVEKIPLKIVREKITLKEKKQWIEKSTVKSISMIYETFKQTYGEQYAEMYLKELILMGNKKITDADRTLIEQRILEILNEENY
ncbi:replication initiation factor domain-containing protein [Enterococcus casseliflavus]|nr:replication initiation factor domain-containing protein [Enterococcus casseliflavus]